MNQSIVMVASYGGPYAGSFVPSLIIYDRVVKKLGYRTVYVFPAFAEDRAWVTQMAEVADKLYFIPYQPYSIDNVVRIRKICREENAKLIYSRMSGWDITARFAMPGLPVIWHMEMELDLNRSKQKLKYLIKYRLLGAGKTYHLSTSSDTADRINSLGVKNTCKWIPNAISVDRLEDREAYDFHRPTRLLIFAYRPYVKGFDLALDTCEKLNQKELRFELIVSAQSDTYDYISKRYGDSIPAWLILKAPTDSISELYHEADIMLSPSRSEGFSYCLAEALYSGLPAVYSDIPGTSWADEMKMTYRFRSGDSLELAEKIRECSEMPISEDAQQYNRILIRQKYSLSTWSERIMHQVAHVIEDQ